MPRSDTHEQKFFNALNDIFVGAKIEGESGYINLMAIKSRYYKTGVFPQLEKDINAALADFPNFREELFDKLYSFFQRYFSESGSIYFRYTPLHQNIYEQVYTDDRDVVLFWKTHMLYYVKTERLFKSLMVEVDDQKYWFDASQIELKRSNEKRDVVFSFREKRSDGTLVFEVSYSERGSKTKEEEILKALKKAGRDLSDETLNKAFRVFEKQSEVDFFINKDARSFLREQFDLWMYQYLFEGQNVWSAERLAQLQALKSIAYKVIDFISQFEDELVRIWNKPKFVRNSHYVITLDKLQGTPVLENILAHPNFGEQVQEWRDLGMIDDDFQSDMLTQHDLASDLLHLRYQHMPFDTKNFLDLELDILALFDNLDSSLDGWLIKSENYQALNTIKMKFSQRVSSIYIDPPFNLDTSDQFIYHTNYKDANWSTLLENRITASKSLLNTNGLFFMRCDYNGNWIARGLLNTIFGKPNFYNELFINRIKKNVTDKGRRNIPAQVDSVFSYRNHENSEYIDISKKLPSKKAAYWHAMESAGDPGPRQVQIEGKTYFPSKNRHFTFPQDQVDEMYALGRIRINPRTGKPQYLVLEKDTINLDTNWTDIPGYSFTTGFTTENSESLLHRVIHVSSKKHDIVMDYFLGSGTTTAVAIKMERRWIGIEMGNHFNSVILPRLKKVLFGDSSSMSKDLGWKGGGIFKYYELEQYEDVLKKARYEDSDLFNNPNQDPYNSYIFLRDLKMLDSIEIDQANNLVRFHPERLYPDIDLAETLSHLTGKWIKRITKEYVVFEDDQMMSLVDPDWQTLKPMIWWQ